jgi:hypothetical protein
MNRKYIKKVSLILLPLLIVLPLTSAFAGGEGMGFTTYHFSDSGGNSVTTTAFNLAKKILSRTVFLLDLEVDNVYVPPITATTGATRPKRQSGKPFEKTRGQAIVGLEQGLDGNTALALNLYRSQEVDYNSNSAILTLTREFNQKNTVLTLRGQYIADQVGKILDNGALVNQDKNSAWGLVNLTRILSPTTVFDLTYDMLYHQGFLSDPYRQVIVFDRNNAFTATEEKHPEMRTRHAVTGKLNQAIPEIRASLSGRYRYYFDDWKVTSHTAEAQFSKYIFNDLIVRFNYRYYTQTRAYFFYDRYAGEQYLNETYRTSDYKLKPFNSNNFGFSFMVLFRGLARSNRDFEFLENSSIEARYFRYFNTLDFSANILQLNINFGI